jgi:hypothetical protein
MQCSRSGRLQASGSPCQVPASSSADELSEFVAIYWKDGRVPLSGQVKKGLAAAFPKF